MEKLKDIDTFYSQKVIPLAFNESLSYMEQICNLISYIENTLVPAINNNANAIKELQEYVQELKRLLDKLEQKVDENFITLNTKIDTTKEELNTKIDTTKEELTTLINNVNDTLTNAINELDSKVVEHINASNEKFNALDTSIESINTNIDTINTNIETINTNIGTINTNIGAINTEVGTINTEVGTMKEQIETINTNVTQNTNDITNLKSLSFNYIKEFALIKPIAGTYYYPTQEKSYKILYNDNMVALFPYHYRNTVSSTFYFRDYNEYQNSFKNYVLLNQLPDNLQNFLNGKSIIVGYYLSDNRDFININELTLNYGTMGFYTTGNKFLCKGKTPEELSNKYVMIVDPTIGFK